MKHFKTSEVIDALVANDFVPEQAKGSHKKYTYKDLPFIVVTIPAKDNTLSENVYKEVINALVLKEIITEEISKRVSNQIARDIATRKSRANVASLYSTDIIKRIGMDKLTKFTEDKKREYKEKNNTAPKYSDKKKLQGVKKRRTERIK